MEEKGLRATNRNSRCVVVEADPCLQMTRLLFFIALATAVRLVAASTEEQTFFAFDDCNIAWQHNLKLTLETPFFTAPF